MEMEEVKKIIGWGMVVFLIYLFATFIFPVPLLYGESPLSPYNSPPYRALNFMQVDSTVVDVFKADDGYNIVVDADLTYTGLGIGEDRAEIDDKDELDITIKLEAYSEPGPRYPIYAGTVSKLTISTINNQTVHWAGNVTVPHQGDWGVNVFVMYDKKNRIVGTTEIICGEGHHIIHVGGQQTIPWNIEYINATETWKISKGSGVQIAVIDTGIDYNHPELKNRVVYGISFVDSTAGSTIPIDYKDLDGHGTLVAGIIAAEDNQIGVVGVAPYSELYAVKVMDNRHSGKVEDLIRGIDWAIKGPDGIEGNDDDADIIHLSLSLDSPSSELENIINYAVQSNSVVVASSGNFDVSVEYPAAYDPVIAVATMNDHGAMYSLSTGPQIDVSAPGVNITSTYLDGNYKTFSGGSLAAPHVSGIIALMLSKNHNLTPSDVRTILADSADDIPPLGYDYRSGYGKVNALKALETMVKEVNR